MTKHDTLLFKLLLELGCNYVNNLGFGYIELLIPKSLGAHAKLAPMVRGRARKLDLHGDFVVATGGLRSLGTHSGVV